MTVIYFYVVFVSLRSYDRSICRLTYCIVKYGKNSKKAQIS